MRRSCAHPTHAVPPLPPSSKQIKRSHTHTPTGNNTPDTDTHTHTTRTTPHTPTNTSHKYFRTSKEQMNRGLKRAGVCICIHTYEHTSSQSQILVRQRGLTSRILRLRCRYLYTQIGVCHPGEGGRTHSRRATFDRCQVRGGGSLCGRLWCCSCRACVRATCFPSNSGQGYASRTRAHTHTHNGWSACRPPVHRMLCHRCRYLNTEIVISKSYQF